MSKATLFGLVLACSPVVGALAFESYPPDSGKGSRLYTDAQARRMAQSAEKLVPIGTTKPKGEVLRALGIDPRRVRNDGYHASMMIILEWWQISPHYQLQWTVNLGEDLSRDNCPVYGVE